MNVVYVLGDSEYGDICKIGYNSEWPKRFEQVRSHTPRSVIVHGIWRYDSKEEIKNVERRIHALLASFHRKICHAREWFDISAHDAIRLIKQEGIVDSDPLPDPNPQTLTRAYPYDDWRSLSDEYKGEVYKRILWVFKEDSGQGRIKVIHSSLFDTCYKYAFTYNPFGVYLAAAFHHPFFPDGPTPELRLGNELVESVWHEIVADDTFGPGVMATNVGWLNKGATVEWVSAKAQAQGLVSYDLFQQKPRCVRPKDAQIKPIPVGGSWLKRVVGTIQ